MYRLVDLTLDDAEAICDGAGITWQFVLQPLATPQSARGVVAVLHSRRTGRTFDDVDAELRRLPMVAAIEMWDTEPDSADDDPLDLPPSWTDGVPPVADGTSTT